MPPLTRLACDCPAAPLVPVISSPAGAIRLCPYCGPVQVRADLLRVGRVDFDAVARYLAKLLAAPGSWRDIPDISWSLGRRGNIPLVYLRRVTAWDVQELIARQYARSNRTWFIVSTPPRAEFVRRRFGFERVSDLFELTAAGDSAARRKIETPPQVRARRARPRRAERLVKIEKLQGYLQLYAKSLVETIRHRELCGLELEIPRRPTQRQLAAKLGLTQSDISNCLRDKGAILLRLLWENLENPEGLIRILQSR